MWFYMIDEVLNMRKSSFIWDIIFVYATVFDFLFNCFQKFQVFNFIA